MRARFVVNPPGVEAFETVGYVTLTAAVDGNDEWAHDGENPRGAITVWVNRTNEGVDHLFAANGFVTAIFEAEVQPSPSTTSDAPSADEPPSSPPESPEPAPAEAPSDGSTPPSDSTPPGESTSTTDSEPSSAPVDSSSTPSS